MPLKVFVDSDVVISSLISNRGASYFLIQSQLDVRLFISNYSVKEITLVLERQGRSLKDFTKLKSQLEIVHLKKPNQELKEEFKTFVNDKNDSHIIAGAKAARATYLISFNLKDFNISLVQQELGIVIMTPGSFLQFLRRQ